MLGLYPSGCICQISSCTSLLFGRLALAMLPQRASFRTKFDCIRSKSKIPTWSKKKLLTGTFLK